MSSVPAVTVCGVGWIDAREHGQVRKGLRRDGAFAGGGRAVKSFGRFDAASKAACRAAALALDDAGLGDPPAGRQGIGVIGTGFAGCLTTNLDYFKDYVRCGRTLARGNLFIYTLPTSALAEAAIHFGLEGPLMYVLSPDGPLPTALEMAGGMIRRGEASAMLVVWAEEPGAACFVVSGDAGAGAAVEKVVEIARQKAAQPELIAALGGLFETDES